MKFRCLHTGLGAALASLLVLGCQDDCDENVSPGGDDYASIIEAFSGVPAGGTVCLAAGDYEVARELPISQDEVLIRGEGRDATILDFTHQQGANGIKITGDGVRVEDLQVKNTEGDGIRANEVEGITFRRVNVVWDANASLESGAYGLYPVGSSDVMVDDCLVKGARDAGIYVGQSRDVVVQNSEAFGNVAGIEIENTTDAIVRDNHSHDNTAGLLIFNLPGLQVKDGKRANVFGNTLENNNLETFAEEGTIVSMVPHGIGAIVLAADFNEFHDNTITGNHSAAYMIMSWQIIALLEPTLGDPMDPEFDRYAEGNYFHDNELSDNGNEPAVVVELVTGVSPTPDIVYDGCLDAGKDNSSGALTNCVNGNGDATFIDVDICSDPAAPSTDIAAVTCDHEPLPTE